MIVIGYFRFRGEAGADCFYLRCEFNDVLFAEAENVIRF
jgi:hypothetical protein